MGFRIEQLLAVIVLSALIAEPATAADMAVRRPIYKARPVPVAFFNWTGCYIGDNIGASWSHSNFATTLDPGGHLALPADLAAVGFGGNGSADYRYVLGGGQVGCNWQSGSFVFGLEADFDGLAVNQSLTGVGLLSTGNTFVITNTVNTHWLATVRPRVGLALGRSLFYATGGLAVTNISYTQTYADTLFATVGAFTGSTTKSGWTVGGGWEYGFTNHWSAKLEYLYTEFSSVNSLGTIASITTGAANGLHGSADLRANIVRVGLNYRFGYGY